MSAETLTDSISGWRVQLPGTGAAVSPALAIRDLVACFLALMLFCAGNAVRAEELPETLSPEQIREELQIARRYFLGGRYAQAEKRYTALLQHSGFSPFLPYNKVHGDDGKETVDDDEAAIIERERARYNEARDLRQRQREEANYYRARCMLEKARASDGPYDEAIRTLLRLANNERKYDRPEYSRDAFFWAGRGQIMAGKYEEALKTFKYITSFVSAPDMEGEVAWYTARALEGLARQVENDNSLSAQEQSAQLRKLRDQRIAALGRIVTSQPDNQHAGPAEVELMELRVQAGEHEDAGETAERLLENRPETDPVYAKALLNLGQIALLKGQVAEAADYFARTAASPGCNEATRSNARLDMGRCHALLAQTASAERRHAHLQQARRALRLALESMSQESKRKRLGQLTLGGVLVKLKEYEDAVRQLTPVAEDPEHRTEAQYLRGIALRGLGLFAEAVHDFEGVLTVAEEGGSKTFLLRVLAELAELESERGQFGAALIHYREARKQARRLREFPVVAESDLGIAWSLLHLGGGEFRGLSQSRSRSAQALLPIMTVSPDEDPRDTKHAIRRCMLRFQAQLIEEKAGIENCDRAISILERLRERYAHRVRGDKLDYIEGSALARKADAAAADALKRKWLDTYAVRTVSEAFLKATTVLAQAVEASPRGAFAPRTYFQLAETYRSWGHFLFSLARRYEREDKTTLAVSMRQEAKKRLEEGARPYAMTAKLAHNDPSLRTKARLQLGLLYLELDENERAWAEFQILADNPDLAEAVRQQAARYWALALERAGKREEALGKLRPQIRTDIRSTVQAGLLLENMGQPRKAYDTYRAGVLETREAKTGEEREVAAELLYRRHRLGLWRAGDITVTDDVNNLRETSGQGLRNVMETYSDTEWATRAFLTYGRFLLLRGREREALAFARNIQKRGVERAATLQASRLIEGRALAMQDETFQAVRETLEKAVVEAHASDRPSRAYRVDGVRGLDGRNDEPDIEMTISAEALRIIGDVARVQGRIALAQDFYARVFATYSDVHEQADKARLAAATIYAERGDDEGYEAAMRLLEQGHDEDRMKDAMKRIRLRRDGRN